MGIIRMGKKSEKKTAADASVKKAAAQTTDVTAAQTTEKRHATWDDPAIISEYEASEHGRHYRLNNGTAKSVISATPVNYYDEEEKAWKEIDNTLEDCGDTYEAKGGKCRTQISKADKGKRVKISKGKAQVSWVFLGKENAETATTFAVAKGGAEGGNVSLKVENGNGRAQRAHSKATYANVAQATDLQYCLRGNNVKENIIVREKAADYRYRFALETQGLRMRLAEDNRSIELYSDSGVEFIIPSPYMYDAAGATNEEVYYELTPEQDGKHTFVVIANEEWINATDRVLPVTIDPQIVVDNGSFVTAVVQSRTCETVTVAGDPDDPYGFKKPTTTVSCWGGWVTEDVSTEIKVDDMSSAQCRTFLTFNKQAFPVLDCPILDIQVLLTPIGDFGGNIELRDAATGALIGVRNYNSADGRFSFDLTQQYKTACGDTFTIGLLPSGIGGRFSLEANPPVLEIEYVAGGGVKPCTKEIPLCGSASGVLDVSTGNFTPELATVSGEGLSIPYGVTQIYKPSAEDHHCGKNFRLNLDERLDKYTDSLLDANYVYTDEYGNKHGFKEHFYYLNDANGKVTVAAKDVTVDTDGSLWYGEHQVTKEELSDTGLKAVTQLEGVQKVEFYEQRQDEIKQLEEQVESYKDALKDYVVINSTTGEIVKEEEKEVTLANLDDGSYDVFMKKLDVERNIPVTTSEKIQYKDLLTQLKSLTENYSQYEHVMPIKVNFRNKLLALQSACYELDNSLEPYLRYLSQYYLTPDDPNNFRECIDRGVSIPLDLIDRAFEDENGYMPYDLTDNNEIKKAAQPKVNGATLKAQFRQRNLYLEQIAQQRQELNAQEKSLGAQKEYMISQKSQVQRKLEQYYKEYVNKSAELALRKKCTPVSYLSDGKTIKGFNEYGDLVAVFDSYENAVMIERDKYGRISRLCDDKNNAVTFAYNSEGLLASVTDVRGRKTKYSYGLGRLCSVSLPNGEKITLSYNDTQLSAIGSSKEAASLSYDDVCLAGVTYKSLQTQIGHDEMQNGITVLSSLSIAYTDTQTTVTASADVTTVETYRFGEKGGLLEYYLEEDGVVTKAERYDYEQYSRDNTICAKNETLYKSPLSAFEFVAGEYENTTLNDFNNPTQIVTGGKILNVDGGKITTQGACVTYTYDDEQRVLEERTVVTTKKPTQTETVTAVKTYAYNAQSSVVRTESYVEGEALTSGKTVEETVYDDKGRVVKSFTYNTLDSSSKFYTENEYDESGKATAEIDETGENKTQIEYVDGTSIVRTTTLPNGSKFSYGHDESDTVTAITQSTSEGEENSTQTQYTCGEITELKSGNNVVHYTYDGKRRKTAVELNGTQYVQYEYRDKVEKDGETVNRVTATLCNDDTIESVSDLRGNVLETKYNGKTLASATYDAKGKRTHLLDGVTGVETATEYDKLDRVKTVTVGNVTETTEYNEDGGIASKTRTENGKETTYTYAYKENAAKDLESVSVGDITVSPTSDCLGRSTGKTIKFAGTTIAEESIAYRKVGDHATNMPSTVRFGNRIAAPSEASTEAQSGDPSVISTEHEVRAEKSQTETEAEKSQFVRLDNLKYTYDACGNITEVRENGSLAVRYTYDALNRLIREDNKQLGKTWVYHYDNNGNILSKREFAFTLCGKEKLEELDGSVTPSVAEGSQTGNGAAPSVINETLYAYDGDRLLAFGSELFKYDALGNPTKYRDKACRWTNGRQLMQYGTMTFVYDGRGRRTKKGGIYYTYDSEGRLLKDNTGLSFIYDHSGVIGFEHNNSTYFYRKNAQGDIIALLDSNGNVVVKYVYDAWGNHAVLNPDGTVNDSDSFIGNRNPYRYRGYYYDIETGLYFLKTRYYDPEVGRFITIDDLSYLDPETINGLNLYAYCVNNPVMATDPNGTMPKWLRCLLGGVIAVAAITLSIATAGLAAPISAAVGGGMFGAILGGAVAGAIGGAISSFAISVALQGAMHGFDNINWRKVGIATLSGAIAGAVFGGVGGGIKYAKAAHYLKANGVTDVKGTLKNFKGIPNVKTAKGTVAYRYYDGVEALQEGRWLTNALTDNPVRDLVLYNNKATMVSKFIIQDGAKYLVGKIAGSPVNAIQFFVANVNWLTLIF
ncbi:MAG: hypothetical protein K2M95_05570 [Clostridiales bacterium]|nr:hypothetical protein [Clostridiales bacterium]